MTEEELKKWYENAEVIYLNEEDWDFFTDIVNNPPEPNEKMKALFAEKGNE